MFKLPWTRRRPINYMSKLWDDTQQYAYDSERGCCHPIRRIWRQKLRMWLFKIGFWDYEHYSWNEVTR